MTASIEPLAEVPGGPLAGPAPSRSRLHAEHYEPGHVPVEVSRHGTEAHTLSVGSPGKVGILDLGFALRGDDGEQRTELVQHYQKSPLQIIKPHYYNPRRPDMPYTYLVSAGGGIVHNDRQRMDLAFGPGTSAHITTQAHTKVYRMESGYATSLVNLDIDAAAYIEYLPDPLIPFADSRFYQRTAVTLHPQGSLVMGEVVYAGRLTHGERHAYAAYASDVDVRRPDGEPVLLDRARLVPADGKTDGLAVFAGRDIVASLFVLTPHVPAGEIADVLHASTAQVLSESEDEGALFGISVLPGSAGAWLRFVGDDTVTSTAVYTESAAAVHELITGEQAPQIRK